MTEKAISFVMLFYNVSREDAINLYTDEILAYVELIEENEIGDVL